MSETLLVGAGQRMLAIVEQSALAASVVKSVVRCMAHQHHARLYKDGYADHFDGAKDFFKYLLDMKKYAKGRKREDITGMGVTSTRLASPLD